MRNEIYPLARKSGPPFVLPRIGTRRNLLIFQKCWLVNCPNVFLMGERLSSRRDRRSRGQSFKQLPNGRFEDSPHAKVRLSCTDPLGIRMPPNHTSCRGGTTRS